LLGFPLNPVASVVARMKKPANLMGFERIASVNDAVWGFGDVSNNTHYGTPKLLRKVSTIRRSINKK
jgi:hypothetical protein